MTHARARVTLSAVAMSIAALAAGCGTASTSGAPAAGATGSPAGTGSGATGSGGSASGTGASASAAPVPTTTVPGNPAPGSAACANWPASAPYESMPLAFIPVTALRCVTGDKDIPGQGMAFTATLERSDGDLQALATALRQRPGHVAQGTMCPMIAIVPPQVVLIAKDGSMIRPKFPTGGCDMIASQALRALNALSWHAVSVRVFPQASGGTAVPGTRSTGDPQPSDMIPGPHKSGVNKPGPGGPAH